MQKTKKRQQSQLTIQLKSKTKKWMIVRRIRMRKLTKRRMTTKMGTTSKTKRTWLPIRECTTSRRCLRKKRTRWYAMIYSACTCAKLANLSMRITTSSV